MLQKLVKSGNGTSSNGNGPARSALSVIGPDVRIVGDIFTQGEMQIDGRVEGDITCQVLVVGEGARISGEVSADAVRVHGEVTGKINAAAVAIAKTAKVVGDVTHETLEIEAGAHMEGHLLRKDAAPRPQAAAKPEALPAPAAAASPAAPVPAGEAA